MAGHALRRESTQQTTREKMSMLYVLLAVLCLFSYTHALTLQVEPKTEECFNQFIDQGKDVSVMYSVTRGGLLDIDVRV